ncbi:hypothetical protein [Paraglaciecola sp. L3A3]|uniref:hypothetical protein n=1 Tax=Paraglaciecola sp. L3A3 TaxID=2686358 RepID=UPI00131BBC1B|nr:hypothetical protein [Paraglaciecola sp. L3A3]
MGVKATPTSLHSGNRYYRHSDSLTIVITVASTIVIPVAATIVIPVAATIVIPVCF